MNATSRGTDTTFKTLYLVRHCVAAGQEPDAPLTEEGRSQAVKLAERLSEFPIERIVSSPYARAVQSVEAFAERTGLPVHLDDRWVERALCEAPIPDWRERLAASFTELDLRLPGGESSREAMARGVAALQDCLHLDFRSTVVVTHGNLLTLLLRHFDNRVGFEEWQRMTNPDVYRVEISVAAPVITHL